MRSRDAARAALPKDLSRTAFIGAPFPELLAWGPARDQSRTSAWRSSTTRRAAKTPYEVACLREANVLGARGHVAAERAFRAGASEFEIALEFMEGCGQRERELPYNPIVALNEGGAVLHYQFQRAHAAGEAAFAAHRRRRRVRRLRLATSRARYSYDDAEFAALIRGFDELQLTLCAQVRVGLDWRDFHQASYRAISEFLREIGSST